MKRLILPALLLLIAISGCVTEKPGIVNEGDIVKVDYVGRLEDGTVFDTSLEDVAMEAGLYDPARRYEPLQFKVGAGQMIPGFDRGILGVKVNETKNITIPPEEAYGEYDPAKVNVIPRVFEIPIEETFNRTHEMPPHSFNMTFGTEYAVGEQLQVPESEMYIIVDNITGTAVTFSSDLHEGDTFPFSDQWNKTVIAANETMITLRHDFAVGDNIILPPNPWSSTVTAISGKNATLRAEEILEPEIRTPFGTMSVSMNETNITLDSNHHLAGKTLIFTVTLREIIRDTEPKTENEAGVESIIGKPPHPPKTE